MRSDSVVDISMRRNCPTELNRKSQANNTLRKFFQLIKYIRPIIYISIVVFGLIILILTYFFIELGDISVIKRCISFYCCCMFAMSMNTLCLYLINTVKLWEEKVTILLATFATIELSPEIQRRIKKLKSKFKLYCTLFATIFISSMLIISYVISTEVEVFIPLSVLLRAINYECADCIVVNVLYLIIMLFGNETNISVLIVTYLIMCVMFLMNFEVLLLIDNVYKRDKELKVIDYKNEKHNAAFVRSQLMRIIAAHLRFKDKYDNIVEAHQMVLFLVLSTSFLGGFSSLITLVCSVLPAVYGLLFFSAFFIGSYLITDLAQDYSNSGCHLIEAIHSLNWYQWNMKNQKIYLTVITNFYKELSVSLYSTVKVGNDLFKMICGISYSFINCVYSMKIKKVDADVA